MESYELFKNYVQSVDDNHKKILVGNKSAAVRARKALSEISRLCKQLRAEIQEEIKDK